MNIKNAYLRFIKTNGTDYYVSISEYMDNHQDQYQDNCDHIVYVKVGIDYEPV